MYRMEGIFHPHPNPCLRRDKGIGSGYLNCAAQQVALSAVLDVPVVQNVAPQE